MKKYLFLIWFSVYLAMFVFILLTESPEYAVKTLYIYSLIVTFPLGVIGSYIMQFTQDTFALSNIALIVLVGVLYFAIGYIQWVLVLGNIIKVIGNIIKRKKSLF